jgi:hypothetical protein
VAPYNCPEGGYFQVKSAKYGESELLVKCEKKHTKE